MGNGTFILLLLFVLVCSRGQALDVYRVGSPTDVSRLTHQVNCLAGGGLDDDWGQGWKYLIENSGGGDIVIIRSDGDRGGYDKWIYKDESNHGFRKVNSVTTLSLEKAQDANDSKVEQAIEQAEMIFFAGGDQTRYIKWFRKSKLEQAVKNAIHVKKIPVAGTSAGMALLAGIDFRAKYDSPTTGGMITSEDALKDPTGIAIDIVRQSISATFLWNVLTDTHFAQRNRYGRIVGFMAKAVYADFASEEQVKSISSDEGTAFCYSGRGGIGRVYGVGNVYFLRGNSMPEVLEPGKPLTWSAGGRAIEAQVLKNGDVFHLPTWQSENVATTYWSVVAGELIRH